MLDSPITKFVVIGSVDHGKSSLCGQILAKVGWVDERELTKIFDHAIDDKMEKSKYARILDINQEELERGKTHEHMNVEFIHNGHQYELVDTPGHQIFIREMISGLAGVGIACLVVSMMEGEFESAFDRGNLKEHLIIARVSGVKKVVILANKMDLIDWDLKIYEDKTSKLISFLKKLGYADEDLVKMPISAWLGIGLWNTDNLPEWYHGSDLMTILADIKIEVEEQVSFTGSKFVLEIKILSHDGLITLGFPAVLHIGGAEHVAKIIGIKNANRPFIKDGDKCLTIWQFAEDVTLETNRVLLRKDSATIGLGRLIRNYV